MQRKPKSQTQTVSVTRAGASNKLVVVTVLATFVWFISATSLASRVHLVMGYATVPAGPVTLELFLASTVAWLFTAVVAGGWLFFALRMFYAEERDVRQETLVIATWGIAGAGPLLANLSRLVGVEIAPNYWEPLWLSAFGGLSCAYLCARWRSDASRVANSTSMSGAPVVLAAGGAALWWYLQSCDYFANYLLGFNDFGHFAQRVANTAAGRGVLLETPVLPRFWDHFNPGLLCLVPLWKIFPNEQLFFAVQALCLSSGGLLLWGMARQLKFDWLSSVLFGLAWLVQPVLGQMNLAYTYGWHPISLAIPLMLAALWSLIAERRWLAGMLAVCAMSMEEGVIVVVALFCALCAMDRILATVQVGDVSDEQPSRRLLSFVARAAKAWTPAQGDTISQMLSSRAWIVLATLSSLGFVLVYRLSGIAEFQTGRFVALGSSAGEVLLSPLLRPGAFWGAIFCWDKLAFCLSLWIPCFLPSLIRGWRWILPTLLPMLVLIVWDHKPATSLAFQYSSTLLPLFWLAALYGARESMRLSAMGALATGLVLSLFVGQMPYSSPTLLDVIGHTYHIDDVDEANPWLRRAAEPDGQWLTEQVARLRQDGGEVLATGRIAAHLVGNRDVETVGQYLERRDRLAQLADRLGNPLGHYRWIILDRRENFQQSPASIATVEQAAQEAGFEIVADEYEIVLLLFTVKR